MVCNVKISQSSLFEPFWHVTNRTRFKYNRQRLKWLVLGLFNSTCSHSGQCSVQLRQDVQNHTTFVTKIFCQKNPDIQHRKPQFQNTLDLFPWMHISRAFTSRGTACDRTERRGTISSISVFVFRGIGEASTSATLSILSPSPGLRTVPYLPRGASTNANVPFALRCPPMSENMFLFENRRPGNAY
jgi:hypothetical protein